ncbi:50S ribosomal protein L32 [Candidatus Roizmanbacteria bacterium RIFCSPLOWO2_01_FULL_42_14]|uniref:Large ribosomal subunit protein bL32 n=4 Tax=Candidatus Roizmaniibacteriota TaxID=1752723 RepID=A0A1F7K1L4_9BACT|nr:MAG: 50S ribosomal protein L32 [Candidatus Roizmanbacteria bacterium RIFCSPHIGHO2_02_FULL_43_11]OGK38496.1 MAG: 50S ribosomal protein L32 [Candidatus Roizmanbacteria bacterium RIFCSPHIGHO2_12_FULL_42_10]OGK51670.1 MAG: 50S ribosomal protein L32 [Candidatus Roizmanbacteria bacterium RIFCSPLOWO2_01_FULL_42_14]OGK61750.1 MAG: 50S ribosomal protein L32 [Candidatus Roizmanbacteria bacterium RIFCSPLOWO2_02_FULL_43_10]
MAPTPKKKHSTMRTGKRRVTKGHMLPQVVYDKNTGHPRLSHRHKNA